MLPLTPEILLRAYAAGCFPMARGRDDPGIEWFSPTLRGVLPLDGFHVPRSLSKVLRRGVFRVRCDTAFADVVRNCAEPAPGREGTWINDEIFRLYVDLHNLGHAHSVESWRDGRLVGGLYGVALGGAFFGESMFSRETDASKVALCHLVAGLKAGGFSLLDTQFITAHLARFGAVEIPRRAYLERLAAALAQRAGFKCGGGESASGTLRHSTSHKS
ncbi:MAG: leucyl/phenylalanyl-tRNA--protein transferase [Alphaproteobacteria bacterium]|nr:leucyl/phenylalanyl-tRNA--protein transferase [Alphaproteobacteria bacterium]